MLGWKPSCCSTLYLWWLWFLLISLFFLHSHLKLAAIFSVAARKQEIIKVTEQLIEAINNGDFEAYTCVLTIQFAFTLII